MEVLGPRSEDELAELIAAALANETVLKVEGGGSRWPLGRPVEAEAALSTRNLSGVSMYEPSELVFTAKAGTTLAEIEAMLAEHNQEMAFEPIKHGRLFGTNSGASTIGGLVATNAAGPRRIRAGAARDHLLGFRAVTGRGEIIKSGGRVMKNVTGYDLSKLMTGSYGTLAVMSEVTVKVMPVAESEQTLLVLGLSEQQAVEAMTAASGLPLEVSSFAHLPIGLACTISDDLPYEQAVTALRLEGPQVSIRQRLEDLQRQFSGAVKGFITLEKKNSRPFWRKIRDVKPLAELQKPLWRLSTAPASGARLMAELEADGIPVAGHFYDWAGGLIWLVVDDAPDAHAAAIRAVVDRHGGHATLMRASEGVRTNTPVFHPQPEALAALTKRVKENFDPWRILNRGRMRGDL